MFSYSARPRPSITRLAATTWPIPDHEITLDGRALWGKTSNDISPLGTFSDSVDGTRSLVMAKVSTKVDAGGVVLRPRISVAQVHESTDAYTDGGGTAVPKVTTTLDQVLAGVEVQKTVTTARGTLTLLGALDGVWARSTASGRVRSRASMAPPRARAGGCRWG